MILNNVIEIMKSFDKEELRKFERFIRSDYFNTNESVMKLFKSIKKYYPEFNSTALVQEKLFKQIYGARKFDDKTFRYLITELMELAEKYIVISAYETRPFEERQILVEELLIKRLYSHANRHLKQLDKLFENTAQFSLTDVSQKRELNVLWNEIVISMDKQDPLTEKRTEQTELLLIYFVAEMASMFSILVAVKRVFNIEFDERFIAAFLKNIDYKAVLKKLDSIAYAEEELKARQLNLSAVKAYLCFMITVMDKNDEEHYKKMKQIVTDNHSKFKRQDLYNLLALLSSCCNIKGEHLDYMKYQKEYFELEKFSNSIGLLKHSDEHYLMVGGVVNLFNIAITLNEVDWAEDFINKNINEISPELKEDLYNYAMANINFERGEFEKALSLISKVSFKFHQFKQMVRLITLKIYYELNYFEEAFSLIDSFSHFLTSNKRITPLSKSRNLNFLSITKDLLKLKTESGFKMKPVNITEKIVNAKGIYYKRWLLEKAEEISRSQNAA